MDCSRGWKARALVAVLLALATTAQGQTARRGLAGAAEAAARIAEQQAREDAEMRLMRQRAELEIETARRLRELRDPKPAKSPQPSSNDDNEVQGLLRLHPQWERIVTSTAFDRWLSTRSREYEAQCRSTGSETVMARCIDEFFGPPVIR